MKLIESLHIKYCLWIQFLSIYLPCIGFYNIAHLIRHTQICLVLLKLHGFYFKNLYSLNFPFKTKIWWCHYHLLLVLQHIQMFQIFWFWCQWALDYCEYQQPSELGKCWDEQWRLQKLVRHPKTSEPPIITVPLLWVFYIKGIKFNFIVSYIMWWRDSWGILTCASHS